MERRVLRDKRNLQIAVIAGIFAVCLTIFCLMYYIRQDYLNRREDEGWYIEFKKNFMDDGKEIECYKMFKQTGYLPRYCN